MDLLQIIHSIALYSSLLTVMGVMLNPRKKNFWGLHCLSQLVLYCSSPIDVGEHLYECFFMVFAFLMFLILPNE